MRNFVLTSAGTAAAKYPYSPFKLSKAKTRQISEFQISFVQDGIRYDYGFGMGPKRVEREWLTEYVMSAKRVQGRNLFQRTWVKSKYTWRLGEFLRGQRKVWTETTRPDALFLSTAIQLNSTQLKPVFEWFQNRLVIIVGETELNHTLTVRMLEAPDGKSNVLPFLKEADLGVADITLIKERVLPGSGVILPSGAMLQQSPGGPPNLVTINLSHRGSNDTLVPMAYEEESSGTQILLRTAGAWLNVLEKGEVLLFDEIDRNLHPNLLRFLIGKFHSKKSNKKNAQLICTTHNTALLGGQLFMRDQIWFVEKDQGGASRLYPLSDFKPRIGEHLEKWYLRGRYGAQPILPPHEF
jgi:AAA15 family ATPase/GTPase